MPTLRAPYRLLVPWVAARTASRTGCGRGILVQSFLTVAGYR